MRPPQTTVGLSAALLVVLALVGCSPTVLDDQVVTLEPDATEPSDDVERRLADPDEAHLAYAACMREAGVPFGDPDGEDAQGGMVTETFDDDTNAAEQIIIDGEEVDPQVYRAADEQCGHLLDGVVGGHEVDRAEIARAQDEMLAFAHCMREHGVDWPDPSVGDDGTIAIELTDDLGAPEDVAAAQEACGSEFGDGSTVGVIPADGDDDA